MTLNWYLIWLYFWRGWVNAFSRLAEHSWFGKTIWIRSYHEFDLWVAEPQPKNFAISIHISPKTWRILKRKYPAQQIRVPAQPSSSFSPRSVGVPGLGHGEWRFETTGGGALGKSLHSGASCRSVSICWSGMDSRDPMDPSFWWMTLWGFEVPWFWSVLGLHLEKKKIKLVFWRHKCLKHWANGQTVGKHHHKKPGVDRTSMKIPKNSRHHS